jgi:hypothetical protein
MKTRKPVYIGIASVTVAIAIAVAAVFVFSSRTFKLVSQDGSAGSGFGVSGKGSGIATTSWVSSDGLTVEQVIVGYSSVIDALSDFEFERSKADRVIEISDSSRMVAEFGTRFKVISLERNQIRYIQSPHLNVALAFERSWWKSAW